MESQLRRGIRWQGQEHCFDLCRKRDLELGPVSIDHWWMPVSPLYSQRRGNSPPSRNHTEILRLYWAAVEHSNSTQLKNAQERYLLASLVPQVRAEGSRTIFADAFLKPASRLQQDEIVQALETQLNAASESELTRAEFFERSWGVLGRPSYPEGVQQIYQRYTRELLEEPCRHLATGDREQALRSVAATWAHWMKLVARRAGHEQEKIALNILSYEARAAFHHCYSLAWCELIRAFVRLDQYTEATSIFLRFWHTDWIDSDNISLFHGHVFGMHPATGPFMLAPTGRQLLGTWLAEPLDIQRFGRLLHGILIALFDYARRREDAAADRPRPAVRSEADLEVVQEIQAVRRRGKLRG